VLIIDTKAIRHPLAVRIQGKEVIAFYSGTNTDVKMFNKVDSCLGDQETKVGITFSDRDRLALEEEQCLV
jgi:hypothetical protein